MSGWRKGFEGMKQKLERKLSTNREFQVTTNARNEAMLAEAATFETRVRVFERDVRALEKAAEDALKNMKTTLLAQLPRAHDWDDEGKAMRFAVPSGDAAVIGKDVAVDKLTTAVVELKQRLSEEVFASLKEWLSTLAAIKDGAKKLEAQRLALDSRRRQVATLEAKQKKEEADVKTPQHVHDETAHVLRHKTEKMEGEKQDFDEREQHISNSLTALISDAPKLRDNMAKALDIIQACYHEARSAFSTVDHASDTYPPATVDHASDTYPPATVDHASDTYPPATVDHASATYLPATVEHVSDTNPPATVEHAPDTNAPATPDVSSSDPEGHPPASQ